MQSPILRLFVFQRQKAAWVIEWRQSQGTGLSSTHQGSVEGHPKLPTSHLKGSSQVAHSWEWPGVSPLHHGGRTSPKHGCEPNTRVSIWVVSVQNLPGEFLGMQKSGLCQKQSMLLQVSSKHANPWPCTQKEHEGDWKG